MKKIIGVSSFSAMFLYLLVLGGSNFSCQKNTDCLADITVQDTAGNRVDSASVWLYSANPPGQVQTTGWTDQYGNCNVNFKLPGIFNVKATGKVGTKTCVGNGIIQLQPGQNVTYTVTIR